MRSNIIELDSELGKKLGFTSDFFSHGIIEDSHPAYVWVTYLSPKPGMEIEGLTNLIRRLSRLRTPTVFIAPSKDVENIAKDFGFELSIDKAGTPKLSNIESKLFI